MLSVTSGYFFNIEILINYIVINALCIIYRYVSIKPLTNIVHFHWICLFI
jgi:hypothetical protein